MSNTIVSANELGWIDEQSRLLPLRFSNLGKNAFDIEMRQNTLMGSHFLFWVTSSATGFQATLQQDMDVWALHLPQRGVIVKNNFRTEYEASPGDALLLKSEGMRKMSASENFLSVCCTFDIVALESCLRAIGDDRHADALQFLPRIPMTATQMQPLKTAISLLMARLETINPAFDLTSPLAAEFTVCHLISAWPQLSMNCPAKKASINRNSAAKAVDFIETNLSTPITVGDIAAAAGTNIRSLQADFKKYYNTTPINFLLSRRLDKAHEDLLSSSNEMVSQVAYRWGFIHLSDFGKRYLQRFGCTPSQTRRHK